MTGRDSYTEQAQMSDSHVGKLRSLLRFAGEGNKDESLRVADSRAVNDGSTQTRDTVNGEVDLTSPEFCFAGHFTRSAKKSLQTAISKGFMSLRDMDIDKSACGSLPADTLASKSLSVSDRAQSTSYAVHQPSPSAVSSLALSEYGAATAQNCSSLSQTGSIAHILTGEDKNLGITMTVDNTYVDLVSDEDKTFDEAQGTLDMESFLDDALRGNSIAGNTENEWDLDNPRKEIISLYASVEAGMESGGPSLSTPTKCTTCLIVQDDTKVAELRQDISQALQIPDIKAVTIEEMADVCSAEFISLIWMYVPVPVPEELLQAVTSLRYSRGVNKAAYFIAITDQQIDVDLHLHGFDDVYTEPIPKDAIYQKYRKFKFATLLDLPGADTKTVLRDTTSTPESTISVESVKTTEYSFDPQSSQSSTCDSVASGVDIGDMNISDLKSSLNVPLSKSPFLSAVKEDRSPVMSASSPSPPSWCRAEHATKEKQRSLVRMPSARLEKERRERIKDSCDQLRVLLPYVKGRKTDMASILEMTVDYLKIVNAALPPDFQSTVIDLMSNGNPALEERLGDIGRATMASKKTDRQKIHDTDAPTLGRPVHNVEKASVETNYTCSNDQNLKDRLFTRSLTRTISSGTADKTNINDNANTVRSCSNTDSTNAVSILCKRECPTLLKTGSSSSRAKRPHIAVVSAIEGSCSPSAYVQSRNAPIKEPKKESILDEAVSQSHPYMGHQFPQLFMEGDSSSGHVFSPSHVTSELFSYHAQTNSSAVHVSATDHTDMTVCSGMYFDSPYYHYYTPLQDSSGGSYFIPGGSSEYVNPNAVLPLTSFTSRVSAFNSHRLDHTPVELDRYGISCQTSDTKNNICGISGLKPNNS